jgi:hypothetical protein
MAANILALVPADNPALGCTELDAGGDTSDSALSREDVLDELDYLATVEHALVVEYLSLYCVFGEGLLPAEAGTLRPGELSAAEIVDGLAQREMRHLRRVNGVLVRAGRRAQVGRASSIGAAGAEVTLGPPSPAQLERLVERERDIASAVDERYARISDAVASIDELFLCPDHVEPLSDLLRRLDSLAPSDYLRVTRRDPGDEVERTALEISDQHYRLIVATVGASFAHEDQLGDLLNRALTTMDVLKEVNHLLGTRGLLPAFRL